MTDSAHLPPDHPLDSKHGNSTMSNQPDAEVIMAFPTSIPASQRIIRPDGDRAITVPLVERNQHASARCGRRNAQIVRRTVRPWDGLTGGKPLCEYTSAEHHWKPTSYRSHGLPGVGIAAIISSRKYPPGPRIPQQQRGLSLSGERRGGNLGLS